jgi:hypothetical protein
VLGCRTGAGAPSREEKLRGRGLGHGFVKTSVETRRPGHEPTYDCILLEDCGRGSSNKEITEARKRISYRLNRHRRVADNKKTHLSVTRDSPHKNLRGGVHRTIETFCPVPRVRLVCCHIAMHLGATTLRTPHVQI